MPDEWYPEARAIKRKIIYHMGPTNSGKTKNAIEALLQAKQGLYLAPLRLLAWEVAEKL
jgi:ATP-dependent RNA helicase SUPV3L1/SUV3